MEVRDSAGISIVENKVAPDLPRLNAEETRRIGLIEGDEPYLLFKVYSLAVSPLDTVFVGNSQTGTVRVFAPEGHFVREFGGIGEGPHEVSMITDVWLSGDTVVVWDPSQPGKAVLFRASGEFVGSWRGRLPDGRRVIPRAHSQLGWIAEIREPYMPTGAPGDSLGEGVELRVFDPVLGSLGEEPFFPPSRPRYSTRAGTFDALFRVYGSGFDETGRFFRTVPERYEVAIHEPDGSLVRLIRRSYDPRQLGTNAIEEYRHLVQGVLDTITMFGPPGSVDDQVWARIDQQANLPVPSTWSPVRSLIIGSDGFLWAENVESAPPGLFEIPKIFGLASEDFRDGSLWDLFTVDGIFVGQVELPPRFEPMAVRGIEVTGVLKDDSDVEYVVTYTARPWGGDG